MDAVVSLVFLFTASLLGIELFLGLASPAIMSFCALLWAESLFDRVILFVRSGSPFFLNWPWKFGTLVIPKFASKGKPGQASAALCYCFEIRSEKAFSGMKKATQRNLSCAMKSVFHQLVYSIIIHKITSILSESRLSIGFRCQQLALLTLQLYRLQTAC